VHGPKGTLTDPNGETLRNSVRIKEAKKIKNRLPLYDKARTSKNRLKQDFDFLKLERLTTIKCNAFAVLFYSRVLKAEKTFAFLEIGYTQGH
jgi:hypothetical protein